MLRNLNQTFSGRGILGTPFVGKLASEIPVGFALPNMFENDIDAGFPNRFYRLKINSGPTGPAACTFNLDENGAWELLTTVDGTYSGTETIEKYDPTVGLVSTEDTTYAFNVGQASVSADTIASYNVISAVAADTVSAYLVLNAIAADTVGIFDVLNAVSTDVVASYTLQTFNAVSADTAATYTIYTRVSSNLVATYQVQSDIAAPTIKVPSSRTVVWARNRKLVWK